MNCLPVILLLGGFVSQTDDLPPAVVNGHPITNEAMESFGRSRGVTKDELPSRRRQLLERMIERELVRQFLAQRGVSVEDSLVEDRTELVYQVLRRQQDDAEAVIERSGWNRNRLAEEIRLDLAWKKYLSLAITLDDQREFFQAHRARFDGTTVHAAQIFVPYVAGESPDHAENTLSAVKAIREEIIAGRTTFADAARRYSQAPSASKGGELGWIHSRGDVAAEVADAAFALNVEEISGAVISPAGLHLVRVSDRRVGDLSLEDARRQVVGAMSEALWRSTIDRLRASATIECPGCETR